MADADSSRARVKRWLSGSVAGLATTLRRVRFPVASSLRILTYHEIVPPDQPVLDPYNQIGIDRFERHLQLFREAGFTPRSVTGSLEEDEGSGLALSFDDGLHEHASLVLPLLKEYGCGATFYIVTGAVLGDTAIEGRSLRFMSASTIREIAAAGIEIGSHGETHRLLSSLGDGEVEREIAGSRAELAEWIGTAPRSFAFPYGEKGSFDERSIEALRKAGYGSAVTTRIGSNSSGGDRMLLKRIPVYHHDTDELVLAKASGHYDWVGAFQEIWLTLFPPRYR